MSPALVRLARRRLRTLTVADDRPVRLHPRRKFDALNECLCCNAGPEWLAIIVREKADNPITDADCKFRCLRCGFPFRFAAA